jgi:uncharacterized protein with GYD domain
MPHYLIQASYTSRGLEGLMKDKASGRKAAVSQAVGKLGGKMESMYYCFGKYDVVVIAEVPDNVSAAALSLAVSASGLVRIDTTPLLTVEETDKALAKTVDYRPPGEK